MYKTILIPLLTTLCLLTATVTAKGRKSNPIAAPNTTTGDKNSDSADAMATNEDKEPTKKRRRGRKKETTKVSAEEQEQINKEIQTTNEHDNLIDSHDEIDQDKKTTDSQQDTLRDLQNLFGSGDTQTLSEHSEKLATQEKNEENANFVIGDSGE